jgi:hypothetical protein
MGEKTPNLVTLALTYPQGGYVSMSNTNMSNGTL